MKHTVKYDVFVLGYIAFRVHLCYKICIYIYRFFVCQENTSIYEHLTDPCGLSTEGILQVHSVPVCFLKSQSQLSENGFPQSGLAAVKDFFNF